jgi:hypothetical protein
VVILTNAANLSLFMVNVVERLLQDVRQRQPNCSVLDLKRHCRGIKYVEETIKLLPETPEPILLERTFAKIIRIGHIHAPPAYPPLNNWRGYCYLKSIKFNPSPELRT